MEQMAQNQNNQNGQSQSGSQQSGSQQQSGQQSGSQSSGGQSGQQSGSQSASASSSSGQSGSQGQQQQRGGSSGSAQDQRIQQALSRLRQANDAMKRNSGQQSSDAARQAADRINEARGLLGAQQQQLATGKLGSLSQEADRIAQEERAQSGRISKSASQQGSGGSDSFDRNSYEARMRERNQLAGDRQQLSNDLSRLQKGLRDSARQMAPNQPQTAQKLRDALTEMDQSDLDNRMQRTADWLRRGVNPNSNGTENEIAQGLQKLSQQLREAQRGMGQEQQAGNRRPGSKAPGDQTAALDQLRRMRGQLEGMGQQTANNQGNRNGQNGDRAQPGAQGQGRNQGPSNAQNGQPQRGGGGQQAANRSGDLGDPSGEIRTGGGGYRDGTAWGNINTGNNTYAGSPSRPVPTDATGNPADTERTFRQQMRELDRLRQMVQSDPNLSKQVRDLTRQMQGLDPTRFPGNPAMVEHMQSEMLSSIDRMELELSNASTAETRTGKSDTVPTGYQDSVADYYRRLSKTR
jgi:hypothetical protein